MKALRFHAWGLGELSMVAVSKMRCGLDLLPPKLSPSARSWELEVPTSSGPAGKSLGSFPTNTEWDSLSPNTAPAWCLNRMEQNISDVMLGGTPEGHKGRKSLLDLQRAEVPINPSEGENVVR